jgi:hypothetical protein
MLCIKRSKPSFIIIIIKSSLCPHEVSLPAIATLGKLVLTTASQESTGDEHSMQME